MSETTKNNRDDLGYLGASFQLKLLWQLLTVTDFAEQIIPNLTAGYFDNQLHKFIMVNIKRYFEQHNLPASLRNRSIFEFISANSKNDVDKELATGVLNQIINYDKNIIDGKIVNDGAVIRKTIWLFVKQQESKRLANEIFDKIKIGSLEDNISFFEDSFKNIMKLGEVHDDGEDVFHNIEDALREDYRDVTPTGIKAMDQALAGGLGRGEMAIGLIPYGVGKTTLGTKFANTAYSFGRNVLQIVFEDNENDIKRKHYTLWSKVPLSELNERREEATEKVKEFYKNHNESGIGGRLIIKKFDQDGITIPHIKNWINNYQKTHSIKFDILILDYLDCIESHKPTHGDTNAAEIVVVKSFLSMIEEFNIPGWTFVQGNRSSIRSEFVHGDQMGGSVKRGQKTHFLFSVAKSLEQKHDGLANVQFIKSRMTRDGQVYENAIFNNDTLEIRCIEGMRPSNSDGKGENEKNKFNNNKKVQPLQDLSAFNSLVERFVDNEVREKQKINETVENQIVSLVEETKSSENQVDKKPENISG